MSIDMAINDKTGDIATKDGKMYYVTGGNEVAQRVVTRIRRIKGEWANYTPAGLPYYTEILGTKDVQRFNLLLRKEIFNTEGVEEIRKLNLLFDNKTNKCSVYAEIKVKGEFFTISEDL